jgi:mannose-6-phosphate isomerase-like protein (cupin superfamily)
MNSSLCQKHVNSCRNSIIKTRPWDIYGFIIWPVGHKMEFHSHDHYQTIQTLDGRLEVDYGKGWEKIERNSTHILPPGCAHRFRTPSGSCHFGIEFTVAPDEMGLLSAIKKVFPVPTIQPMCFYKSWEDQLLKGNLLGLGVRLRLLHVLEDWTISLIEAGEADACDSEAARLVELLKTWSRRSVRCYRRTALEH